MVRAKEYSTGLTRQEGEIILCYAKNNMGARATGRELHLVDMTVNYHLKKIFAATGLKPQRFYDLVKLIPIAMKTIREADEEGDV